MTQTGCSWIYFFELLPLKTTVITSSAPQLKAAKNIAKEKKIDSN